MAASDLGIFIEVVLMRFDTFKMWLRIGIVGLHRICLFLPLLNPVWVPALAHVDTD